MWCRSTVTLCLVFNLVNRNFMVFNTLQAELKTEEELIVSLEQQLAEEKAVRKLLQISLLLLTHR